MPLTRDFLRPGPRRAWRLLLLAMIVALSTAIAVGKLTQRAKLNISCFAYRDINRNGIYDMPDRPYAGLRVRMERPLRWAVTNSSNIAGFTNFKMSWHNPAADISGPGSYHIEAMPPAGWFISSGNRQQTLEFKRVPGSPAGIAVEDRCTNLGLAPRLWIEILQNRASATLDHVVVALDSQHPERRTPARIGTGKPLRAGVEPGNWQVTITRPDGESTVREVAVGAYPLLLSAPNPDRDRRPPRGVSQRADFDHLTPSDTLYEIPHGYVSLDWINWVATHQKLYRRAGMVNGTVSSEYFAYNSSGHPAEISSLEAFDFVGTHITAALGETANHDIVVEGWRGDILVYQDRLRVSDAGPVYFLADYRGINRLRFASEGYWQFALDDLDFRRDG